MNREEFLEILRNTLSGQMQEGKAAAHVRYYQDYIQSQVQKGRGEAEVLAELGDPRLIAKTLLDTDSGTAFGEEYDSRYPGAGSSSGGGYGDSPEGPKKKHVYKLDLTTWYGKAIVIAVAAVAVVLLIMVIGAVLPFFLALAAILYLISRLRK